MRLSLFYRIQWRSFLSLYSRKRTLIPFVPFKVLAVKFGKKRRGVSSGEECETEDESHWLNRVKRTLKGPKPGPSGNYRVYVPYGRMLIVSFCPLFFLLVVRSEVRTSVVSLKRYLPSYNRRSDLQSFSRIYSSQDYYQITLSKTLGTWIILNTFFKVVMKM